ncbi:MAG: sulfatase [Promethearchaeota archaeon]|nr:MAG: sulfatase [Candidatus Lokiarchaeota archaeon]
MKKPNVIFVLIDDLGWADLECYGHPFNETPHIDQLAETGIRFTDAYAAAPVCSPSRAALLTGQCPPRNGITDFLRPHSEWFLPLGARNQNFADNELPEDTDYRMSTQFVTMAEMFKKSGYATGIIGKWHLSGYDKHGVKYGPAKYGFDDVLLSEQTGIGSGSYFHPYDKVDATIEPVLGENEFLIDRMNYEAVEFIKRHKEKPFFLYLSHYAVHTTLDAKEEDIQYFSEKRKKLKKRNPKKYQKRYKHGGNFLTTLVTLIERLKPGNLRHFRKNRRRWIKYNNPVLAAMLKSIDEGIGEIVETLKEFGIYEDTIIVFTSDNGGELRVTRNRPMRGGKSFTYEGGLRVPQIISYPEMIDPQNISEIPTIHMDFYPTFAELIGYRIPKDHKLDGISLLPILKNEPPSTDFTKRTFSWLYPLKIPHFLGGHSSAANRKEEFKYLWFFDRGQGELYDLQNDVSETTNLVERFPQKAQELRKFMKNWIEEVGGTIPKGQKEP